MNLGANLLDSLSNPVSCGVAVSRSFEGIEGSCPGTLAALNESLHRMKPLAQGPGTEAADTQMLIGKGRGPWQS